MTLRFGWLPDVPKATIGLVERGQQLFVVEQAETRVRVLGVVRFVAADQTMTDAVDRYIGKGSSSEPST